jgi:acetate---CoA ligase (ADP-forming)
MASAMAARPLSMNGERAPNFTFPETPARVLSKLAIYSDWRNKPDGMIPEFDDIQPHTAHSVCQSVLHQRGPGWLSTEETRNVLGLFALPLVRGGFCRTADEAEKKASEIGFPVAVKLASTSIVHKTEMGAFSSISKMRQLCDERSPPFKSDSQMKTNWMRWMEY